MREYLTKTFLFKDLDDGKIRDLVSDLDFSVEKFKKGDTIYSHNDLERKIGFVISGKASVLRKKDNSDDVILNILDKYDSFGVLAAFSADEFPTCICAMKDCEILFFKKNKVVDLASKCPEISFNIINFLADRIAFLNRRIATFTCSSVESKLANYILIEHSRSASLEIPFNCKRVATVINAGRASVYRALESLTADGAIIYDTKKIIIKNISLIERTSK